MSGEETLRRWRLILGEEAAELGVCLAGPDGARDEALAFLYDRARDKQGGREASRLAVPDWLARLRRLFPQETITRVERHAFDQFGLTELLDDPRILASLEPSAELLRLLLTFRPQARPELREILRGIARRVAEEIRRRIASDVSAAMGGRRDRRRRGLTRSAANFDPRGTLRASLRQGRVDPDSGRLLVTRLLFHARSRRHLPWHLLLCVDQSGSMFDSLLHAAVMASILAHIPALSLRMVLFDTTVVDVTGLVEDPAELILSVHLGGGTNIGGALRWCSRHITQPSRTILALVSDFHEGGPPAALLAEVQRLNEAGVTLIGLAALDDQARPSYDRAMAARLVERGMAVAAMTPGHFAGWLAERLR